MDKRIKKREQKLGKKTEKKWLKNTQKSARSINEESTANWWGKGENQGKNRGT